MKPLLTYETGQFQASQVKLPMTGPALDLRGIRRGQEFPYPGFPFGAVCTKGESAECTEPHLSHSKGQEKNDLQDL